MRDPLLLAVIVCAGLGTSCRGGPSPASSEPAPAPAIEADATVEPSHAPERPQCEALPGWRYEQIALPPEFAPELPEGIEVLWFSPGMFEPGAADYFTYAFSLDMKAGALDPAATEALLVEYYRGLMKAVAAGRRAEPNDEAVVTMAAEGREATIALSDEFTTGETVTLHLRLSSPEGSACLRILATARPTDANWSQLSASFSCLCDRAP